MDVNAISNAAAQNVGQFTAQKNSAAKIQNAVGAYANAAKTNAAQNSASAAYSVNISDAAQAMAKDANEFSVDDASAQKTKGLTADQVASLKADLEVQQNTMLNLIFQTLNGNNKNQSNIQSLLGNVDTSRFALPEVATNPEDAAKAVADGGEWSVNAVSDRIFGLAELFAGGDPEKLQQMRAAVEEGFKQAGATLKEATGKDSMPDITKNTYAEVMKRFENAMNSVG